MHLLYVYFIEEVPVTLVKLMYSDVIDVTKGIPSGRTHVAQ
jgi:hypothetical protein